MNCKNVHISNLDKVSIAVLRRICVRSKFKSVLWVPHHRQNIRSAVLKQIKEGRHHRVSSSWTQVQA